jgi:DNA polymerase
MSESLVLNPVGPHLPTSNPSQLAFVGEAPGAQEIIAGEPFIGKAGDEFNRWLHHAGLKREEHLITNVFKYKPVQNKIATFFIKKTAAKKIEGWTPAYPYNSTQGFCIQEREPDLLILREELRSAGIKVVIGMGATALWAFTGLSKITAHRGTVFTSEFFDGILFIPTFHPSYIQRGNFDKRSFVMADILKAVGELDSNTEPEIPREIWTEPDWSNMMLFIQEIFPMHWDKNPAPIAVDIETGWDQITCIAFAPNPHRVLVVPFWDSSKSNNSFWETISDELGAWHLVKGVLEDPRYTFIFHNGAYDIMWLKEKMGITVNTPFEDTMHMHHAMQPELPKALGVLGSLYTKEASWKHLVKHIEEK